jgi:hypothetical protein
MLKLPISKSVITLNKKDPPSRRVNEGVNEGVWEGRRVI